MGGSDQALSVLDQQPGDLLRQTIARDGSQ